MNSLRLIEMVAGVGQTTSASETPSQVVAAWSGGEILGIASLRPSIVMDAAMTTEGLAACLPMLAALGSGLIKSSSAGVGEVWSALRARGRRALIDRRETAYMRSAEPPMQRTPLEAGCALRHAEVSDLEDLIEAARASLREENRPDPFEGDPKGFRRWVRGVIRIFLS